MKNHSKEAVRVLDAPAMRLLLACCMGEMSAAQEKTLHTMVAGFSEWDLFFRLAVKHRVFPVVYKNLSRLEGLTLDERTMRFLRAKSEGSRMASLMLAAELTRLTGLLGAAGIRAISLKGPALGLELYGDVSLRPARDLDILVARKDFERAERLLHDAGYVDEGPPAGFSLRQQQYLMKGDHHVPYINRKNGILVELHWRYHQTFSHFRFGDLWKSREVRTAFGKEICVLNDEENFLYLVSHGAMHAWMRLRWLCDVNELVMNRRLDWSYVAARAELYGTTSLIRQTFILLKRLFGTEAPAAAMSLGTPDRVARRLARTALLFIASDGERCEESGHPLFLVFKRYRLECQKSVLKKIQYLLVPLQPGDSEFQAIRISDTFFFLYFLFAPYFKLRRLVTHSRERARENVG